VLTDSPPDDVAVIPGMREWANAWVLAAAGRVGAAGDVAIAAARDTAAVGAVSTAMWYLADAARFGATRGAADVARGLADRIGSNLTSARWQGILARAEGRPEPLVDAAEAHLAVGLFGHAAELADLAVRQLTASDRTEVALAARARKVAASARGSIGAAEPTMAVELPEQLTRREVEIARLAARGMRDKDIADELVLSVRTVESHLATVYRKLRINSRRELVDVLGLTQ
jgi:DNA-binding CsgD family transcriptional regulator